MKKSLSKAVLVFGTSMMLATSVFASDFKDVTNKHWAYEYAMDMQTRGLMVMNSKGEFLPNQKLSYFEIADVLARATGYQDEKVNPNMDEDTKQMIRKMCEKYKPTLDNYAKKYSSWDKAYNEEISYLLGRGYMKTSDLDKFIVKTSSGKQVKKILSKQDLSNYIVHIMLKAKTAETEFAQSKTTGFKDESSIKAENKPYVAYLKKQGILTPDAKGNCNPNDEVTRAIAAKMISEALAVKEEEEAKQNETNNNNNSSNGNSNNGNTTNNGQASSFTTTIKKAMPVSGNSNEYYFVVDPSEGTSIFTMKNTAPITDASGNSMQMSQVAVGSKVNITVQRIGTTDYITKMQVVSSDNTGSTSTPNTSRAVEGTIDRIGKNGDLSIITSSSIETKVVDADTLILMGGKRATIEDLSVGIKVKAYIQNDKIVRLETDGLPGSGNNGTTTGGVPSGKVEIVSYIEKKDNYVFKTKDNTKETEISVPKSATITRNGKNTTIPVIRTGDTVTFTSKNGVVETVTLTGTEERYTGKVTSIVLASTSKVTIETTKGKETFNIAKDVDIYDSTSRKDLTLSELKLGQEVTVRTESKEAISLVVTDKESGLSYKGKISAISRGNKDMEVLVEYDPLTGENMLIKRIDLTGDVKITKDGRTENRGILEEGMEVIVVYGSSYHSTPEKIMIVK